MKRVLVVYHHFAQYRLPVLRELMQLQGYEYTLLSASHPQDGNRGIDPALANLPIEIGGLKWKFIENVWVGGARSPLLWQKGLLKHLKEDDYDAVIFLGAIYYLTTWLGIRIAKKRNKRVILWTHGFLGKDPRWLAMIRHWFYRSADACLLYGNRARDYMLETSYYDESQLYVVYNSLDYKVQVAQRHYSEPLVKQVTKAELFSDANNIPVVGYIGRVEPRKSLGLLVDAWSQSRQRGVHYNVVIIGEGSSIESLRAQIQRVGGDDHIILTGYREGEEACRLLGASDVCVVPGAIGLTAIHAMTMGIPVVSHDDLSNQGPECEAIVSGQTGALFSRGSSSGLADVLERLLQDETALSEMGENCFRMIDEIYNPSFQAKVISYAVSKQSLTKTAMKPSTLFLHG